MSKREGERDIAELEWAWGVIGDPVNHGGPDSEAFALAMEIIERWKSRLVDVNMRGRIDVAA